MRGKATLFGTEAYRLFRRQAQDLAFDDRFALEST